MGAALSGRGSIAASDRNDGGHSPHAFGLAFNAGLVDSVTEGPIQKSLIVSFSCTFHNCTILFEAVVLQYFTDLRGLCPFLGIGRPVLPTVSGDSE